MPKEHKYVVDLTDDELHTLYLQVRETLAKKALEDAKRAQRKQWEQEITEVLGALVEIDVPDVK